jgi:ABC-type uncharacterized transport system substrate-binding protein
MDSTRPARVALARSLLILFLISLSGCAILSPEPPEPVVEVEPEPAPEPEPEPPPVIEPEPEPLPPPEPAEPKAIGPLVAIVLSNRTPAFVAVSDALDHYLVNHKVYDLSDRSLQPNQAFADIAESEARAVVAVGMTAAEAASRYSTVPVIVSQVFNIKDSELLSPSLKAIRVLPPIDQQVEAWLDIDPSIRNVGALLGSGHDQLIAETDQAMKKHGIKFHYAFVESDREVLYLFNRLVREIDGFMLFPDNRILSRNVLMEMMSIASRNRVQVAVFNDPLLQIGATFSTSAVESDIAATITRALNKILEGNIDDVPPVSDLSALRISTNPAAFQRLGLNAPDTSLGDAMADAE